MSEETSPTTPPSKVREPGTFLNGTVLTRSERLTALVALFVTLVVFRAQTFFSLSSRYLGGAERDAGLYAWLLKLPSGFSFTSNAFYPYSTSLAFSDNFILPAVAALPFRLLGFPEPLIFNVIILAAEFLSGYCTYRLLLRLSGSFQASLFGGLVFLASAYFSAHLGHPQLQFAFFIPLAAERFLAFVESPSFKNALFVTLLIPAAFLTAVYFAIFIVLLLIALLGGLLLLRPRALTRSSYKTLALASALALIVLIPFVLPYLAVESVFGARGQYEAYAMSATTLSYVASSTFSLLYSATAAFSHSEAHLFSGFVVLALALLAFRRLSETRFLKAGYLALLGTLFALLVLALPPQLGIPAQVQRYACAITSYVALIIVGLMLYRLGTLERKLGFSILTHRASAALVIFCALFFFILSLGPLGNPEEGHSTFSVFTLLYYLIPGIDSVRAISRVGIITNWFLTVAASLTLAHLLRTKKLSPRAAYILTACALLEQFPRHYPLEALPTPPAVLHDLSLHSANKNAAMIVLPFSGALDRQRQVARWSEFARIQVNAMQWASDLGMQTVNGYSGQRTKIIREWPAQLLNFPDRRSLQTLARIVDLRYLVFAPRFSSNFDASAFEEKVKAFPAELRFIAVDAEKNYLFELSGEADVNPHYFLLAPARPGKRLHLAMQAVAPKDVSEATLEVELIEGEKRTVFATVKLTTNSGWQDVILNLPSAALEERVRPLQIGFVVPTDTAVKAKGARMID